ncbi:MAG: MFS transporter [Pseudomonadota bacterium]|jgi:MFS family permease|nr:MFS transporter [Pseudomonadota bacterium]
MTKKEPLHGKFHALLLGASCQAFAFFGEQVIVGYVVFRLTESSTWVGVSLALYFAPMFAFGLASGAIADWAASRRTLICQTEFSVAAVIAVFALYTHWVGLTLLPLLLLSSLSGTGMAMHHTLRGAIAFDLAGPQKIMAGLGQLNLGVRIGQLIGAAAAGLAAQAGGFSVAFAVIAMAHFVSALFYRGLPATQAVHAVKAHLGRNLRRFVHEVRTNNALILLVALTAAVEVLGFSFVTALPVLASSRFDVGPDGLGTLHSARAIGGILAALAFATALRLQPRMSFYIYTIGCFGATLGILSAAPNFWSAFTILVVIAGVAIAADVLSQSMVQLSVADEFRGRAMGAWVFAIGAAPLGHLELGFMIDLIGVKAALLVNGTALLCLAAVARSKLKNFSTTQTTPTHKNTR